MKKSSTSKPINASSFVLLSIMFLASLACFAQSNDDEMAKALIEKMSQGKGDIVMRPSDLPEQAKPKVTPPKVNPNPVAPLATSSSTMTSSKTKGAEKEVKKGVHWSYESGESGPENWGALGKDNAMCSLGQIQSPINIENGIQVDLPIITFDYKPSQLTIQDNGHTIMVSYGEGSNLSLQAKQYRLVQFHFHHPGEEAIDGKRSDMVAHLVHQHNDGSLLVVAILLNVDEGKSTPTSVALENPLFQQILNNVPLSKNVTEVPMGVVIDVTQLLPKSHGYYTFVGSLTTPPCTENVTWVVLKESVKLSKQQLENFSRIYPNNARPLQPKRDRLIKETR